ncbi:MAG: DNA glycosylase, partial [Anaerovoracaceae bacterium]
MIKFKVEAFNLEHIFDCGQCFRWEPQEDGSYTGIAGKTIANIAYQEGEVIIDGGGSEAFWKNYLDLERNYGEIKKELICKDPSIKEAIDYGYGIRILNQDRWEALISFIISANNNIPRIKKNIESLAQGFGTLAGEFRGKEY